MRVGCLAAAVVWAAAFSTAWAAEPGSEMRVRFHVFAIAGGMSEDTQYRDRIWAGEFQDLQKLRGKIKLFDLGRFQIGQDTLEINDKGCFLNGTSLFFGDTPDPKLPRNRIRQIPAPDVFLGREESSTLRIGSKQQFEYLVRRDDGCYERQQVELPTGLTIKVRPKQNADRAELKAMKIAVQAVGRREPVAGLALPVGKPISETHDYNLDLRLQFRKPYGILIRMDGGQSSILVCLDVTDVPEAVFQATRREFPGARVDRIEWNEQGAFYNVYGATTEGRGCHLRLGRDGTVRHKGIAVESKDVPAPALQAIAKGYPKGKMEGEIERAIEDGKTFYRVRLEIPGDDNDKILAVTAEGKLTEIKR